MSQTAEPEATTEARAAGRPTEMDRRTRIPVVLPGLIVIAAGLVMAVLDGGYEPTVWYPAALFLLALLASAVVAAPPTVADRRPLVSIALLLFALLTVWALLSISWADAPGPAWDGANRVLLYLIALLTVCLRPWSARDGLIALVLVATVVTGAAVWLVIDATTTANPGNLFIQGRLASPIGYLNASANLWLIGFFPALHLALSRALPWPVRGLGLGAATLLLEMALLSQSRGAAIAIAVATVAYIAMSSRRIATGAALVAVVGLTAIAGSTLLDVRNAVEASDFGPVVDDAARAIWMTVVAAIVIGAAAAFAGRRLQPAVDAKPGLVRWGDRGVGAFALLAVLAALVAIGNPASWLDARWDDFKNSGYTQVDAGTTRFGGSLGSGRYDFYRVAVDEFSDHPVTGIGADNFAAEYLRDRRTAEGPRYPHSVALMVLSQLGVVGAALLAAFLALLVVAAVRARRSVSREQGAVIAALFAAATVWFTHALGDWLWEFPALGLLGLCLLAVAARSQAEPDRRAQEADRVGAPQAPMIRSLGARILLAAVALAAAVSLSLPGVAARYLSSAYENAAVNPASAQERLERAAEINPLGSEALIAKGVVAQRLGRNAVAQDAFERALERDPDNWFAHLELGLVLALQGRTERAQENIRRALELNPDQPITREVLRTVRRGEAVSAREVERRLNEVLERRFNVTDPSATGAGQNNGG